MNYFLQEIFFGVQREEEAVLFFVELDMGCQNLVGIAGKAGLEQAVADLAVGNVIGPDAEGFRNEFLPGLVVQGEPDVFLGPRSGRYDFDGHHHEGSVLHLDRAFFPADPEDDPARFVPGQTTAV